MRGDKMERVESWRNSNLSSGEMDGEELIFGMEGGKSMKYGKTWVQLGNGSRKGQKIVNDDLFLKEEGRHLAKVSI
jgi:hypothetical protein